MAITDTLTAIKNYFKEWHTNYYNELHINIAQGITNDPIEGAKIPTSKMVFDYIKDAITNTITNTGENADKVPTSASIYKFFMNKWKAATKTTDGYLTKGDYNTFYQGGATNYSSKTHTYGKSHWYRQGHICIANLRGLRIGKGKDLSLSYVLCAVPDAQHKPSNNVYMGSFTYDEVKWIAVTSFDNYNPTKAEDYYMWYNGTTWKKLTKAEAAAHLPHGGIVYKPLDKDHDRYVYATITYYAGNEL